MRKLFIPEYIAKERLAESARLKEEKYEAMALAENNRISAEAECLRI